MNQNDFLFHLYVEWWDMYYKYLKWLEDLLDLFWTKKLEED